MGCRSATYGVQECRRLQGACCAAPGSLLQASGKINSSTSSCTCVCMFVYVCVCLNAHATGMHSSLPAPLQAFGVGLPELRPLWEVAVAHLPSAFGVGVLGWVGEGLRC